MPIPPAWTMVPIAGNYAEIFGPLPAYAAVQFSAPLNITSGDTMVLPGTLYAQLDANGHLSTSLPATDDPSLNVQGWQYRVQELWPGGRTFYISVPRFDHDPLNGTALGLLVEQQSTNLMAYSQTLQNWNSRGSGGTITPNSGPANAPDLCVLASPATGLSSIAYGTSGGTSASGGLPWSVSFTVGKNSASANYGYQLCSLNGPTNDPALSTYYPLPPRARCRRRWTRKPSLTPTAARNRPRSNFPS